MTGKPCCNDLGGGLHFYFHAESPCETVNAILRLRDDCILVDVVSEAIGRPQFLTINEEWVYWHNVPNEVINTVVAFNKMVSRA